MGQAAYLNQSKTITSSEVALWFKDCGPRGPSPDEPACEEFANLLTARHRVACAAPNWSESPPQLATFMISIETTAKRRKRLKDAAPSLRRVQKDLSEEIEYLEKFRKIFSEYTEAHSIADQDQFSFTAHAAILANLKNAMDQALPLLTKKPPSLTWHLQAKEIARWARALWEQAGKTSCSVNADSPLVKFVYAALQRVYGPSNISYTQAAVSKALRPAAKHHVKKL